MAHAFWLANLTAYSVQVALLVSAAGLLTTLLRLRNPAVLYRGWQLVLAVCVVIPLLQPWKSPGTYQPVATPAAVSSLLESSAPGISLSAVILGAIAIGAVGRLCWLLIGFFQLRRYRRAQKIESLPESLAHLRHDWGRHVDLYLQNRLEGAVSFGLRRPAILLPESFFAMDLPAQKAVLCHELFHIRRGDWSFALAEEFVRSLLWFHPAIHWTIDRIQLAREQVVDREVVRLLGERESYLETLLETAATRSRQRLAAALTFLRTRHLRQRVALILKEDKMSKPRLIGSTLALVGVLALTAVWAGWSFPLQMPHPLWGPERLPQKLYKVGGDVSSPQVLHKVEPEYTQEARAAKLQGTVVMAVEIGATGVVEDFEIKQSLGLGLDENAIDAVRKWQFTPAMKDGQPVPVSATIEINYRLL